jgi:hypothetical protein
MFQANGVLKQVVVAVLRPNKTDFKSKLLRRENKHHTIL